MFMKRYVPPKFEWPGYWARTHYAAHVVAWCDMRAWARKVAEAGRL